MKVSLARVRAHWHRKAGLAEVLAGELDDVIARTGWVRTLGGADVYLAIRARAPGTGRRAVDALVEAGRLRVIPAVRGCVYLVPAPHVPLALRVAEEPWRKSADRDLARVGARWKEVEEVGRAVAAVLARGPATTDAIRKALGTVRSFGEKGKKVGVSSPLPLALRDLELRGVIERTLEGGRLDTDRYVWRAAAARPDVRVPDDRIDRLAAIARIFAGHAGPTTIADLATWAGIGKTDAKAAAARAGLVKVEVEEYGEAWALEEDVAALSRPAGVSSRVALLSFEDGYLVAHGGKRWTTRTLTVGDEVAGIWEMDPDVGDILWATFATVPRAARTEIDRLASETARFLAEDLGHARSFSLDTDATVRERAAEVAKLAGAATGATKKVGKTRKRAR